MQPLKIVAEMLTPLAVSDDWTPNLESVLEWLILEEQQMIVANPTEQDVTNSQSTVDKFMPISKGYLKDDWYWQVSSPCYYYLTEQTDRIRKKWNPGVDSPSPDWGKRKAKWQTSEGPEKSYDLPLYFRIAKTITWYCVGKPNELKRYLLQCSHLGKKRSIGYGAVSQWSIEPIAEDRHLIYQNHLMRPIPTEYAESLNIKQWQYNVRNWGWRPPAWLPSNKRRCAMPLVNAVRSNDG